MTNLHVMLDLETLDTRPAAVITNIGACIVDINLPEDQCILRVFYRRVEVAGQRGRTIDADTVLWWMRQTPEARAELVAQEGRVSLRTALEEFAAFYLRRVDCLTVVSAPLPLWGNGSEFDNVILHDAFIREGLVLPWSHKQNRCFRTQKNEVPGVEPPLREGIEHHALHDAVWQAKYLRRLQLRLQELPAHG